MWVKSLHVSFFKLKIGFLPPYLRRKCVLVSHKTYCMTSRSSTLVSLAPFFSDSFHKSTPLPGDVFPF